MRSQLFGFSFVFAALVGCGGGGESRPDAKIFLDAPIDATPMCSVGASLGGLTLAGMNNTAISGDWVDTDRMGSLVGRTVISIGGRLPSSTAAAADVLIVDYVKPMAGGYQLNTAINFDPNPNAMPYVAASYLFGDVDSTGMNLVNFFYASTGAITFTQVNDPDGSPIVGSVSASNYREIDDQGADVAGGCTTALTGLNFNLVQMNMAFQPTGTPTFEGALQPLSPEEWTKYRAIINERMAAKQAQQ